MVCVISSPPAAVGKAHTETQKEMERLKIQRKSSQMFKIRDWDPGSLHLPSSGFRKSLGVLRGMVCSLMSLPLTHDSVGGNYRKIKSEKFGLGDL